jgi:hypothetical protein
MWPFQIWDWRAMELRVRSFLIWAWGTLLTGGTWLLLPVLFGLLPLWIRIITARYDSPPEVDWNAIMKDGMLLYFDMALVSTVTADYFLSERRYRRYPELYQMIIFPTILYVISIILLLKVSGIELNKIGSETTAFTLWAQVVMTILSCLYAFGNKATFIQWRSEQ